MAYIEALGREVAKMAPMLNKDRKAGDLARREVAHGLIAAPVDERRVDDRRIVGADLRGRDARGGARARLQLVRPARRRGEVRGARDAPREQHAQSNAPRSPNARAGRGSASSNASAAPLRTRTRPRAGRGQASARRPRRRTTVRRTRPTTRSRRHRPAIGRVLVEVIDPPHASLALEQDVVPAGHIDLRAVPRHLHGERLGTIEPVDERAQVRLDGGARRGREHAHEARVAPTRQHRRS